ncbi:hypothetical protein C2G38_93109 [Gigaspora rosea]|uniref:Zinc-ribbon domain-containing protein n=1 Tax=Gigaspora rosea TaxID=44941 RepID=A0A397UN49_9GLOM|nr:hypothetical protein C2G38_93109 [Gigaspora rosea]
MFNSGSSREEISKILRQYTDDVKNASMVINKYLRKGEFIVFDLNKPEDDPHAIRLRFDTPLDLRKEIQLRQKKTMKKLSLNDACIIAKERDGICLSTEYKDNKTPLMWRCSKNHVWSAPLSRIKNLGQWCPQCAEKYINNRLPLLWSCIKGHLWYASLSNVKDHGKWCPYCAGNARLTLEDAKQIALSRNGKCLSTAYSNSKTPMTWKCHQGHIWNSSFKHIKNSGTWCPYCAGIAKLTLEDAKQIALSRGGECLSTEYKNIDELLMWRCQFNHQWQNTFYHIKNREQWCPFCIGRYQTIEDMRKLALKKNGDGLSDRYYNSHTKLEWVCENKHRWEAIPNSIQQGTWCPFCPKYKREKLCHEILTKYLGAPSLIRRPEFLKTQEYPNRLELDIFYPQYGFAIEVQGIQHEKYHEFFHGGDPNNFIKQQVRDQLKKELCEENCIALRYNNSLLSPIKMKCKKSRAKICYIGHASVFI